MGTVPLVLSLQLDEPGGQLGSMIPGIARDYDASVDRARHEHGRQRDADASPTSASGTGRLANGTTELASPLQVRATNTANPNTAFAPLRGLSNPVTLLSYDTGSPTTR